MAVLAKCLQQLRAEVNDRAPTRSTAADGWIGDPAHAARKSDHNAVNGVVHAIDITHDPAHGADMDELSEAIKLDPRVKYIIWNRRIWNPSVSRSWRDYFGKNPHTHHMHVSCRYGSGVENDTSPWLDGEETDLTPQESKRLERVEMLLDKLIAGLFEKDDVKAKAATGRGSSLFNVAVETRNAVVTEDGG